LVKIRDNEHDYVAGDGPLIVSSRNPAIWRFNTAPQAPTPLRVVRASGGMARAGISLDRHAANAHMDLARPTSEFRRVRDPGTPNPPGIPRTPLIKQGFFNINEAPGLAIDINEKERGGNIRARSKTELRPARFTNGSISEIRFRASIDAKPLDDRPHLVLAVSGNQSRDRFAGARGPREIEADHVGGGKPGSARLFQCIGEIYTLLLLGNQDGPTRRVQILANVASS